MTAPNDPSQPIWTPPTTPEPYQQPTYQDPTYQDPTYQDPTYQDPTYQDPTYPSAAYQQEHPLYAPQPNAYGPAFAPEPQFIPLAPPKRSRRGLAIAIGFALAFVLALTGVLVGMHWLDSRGATPAAALKPLATHPPQPTHSVPAAIRVSEVAPPSVAFRSQSAHFAARFPAEPQLTNVPVQFGPVRGTLHLATDRSSMTVVESMHLNLHVTAAEQDELLRGTVNGMKASSQLTEVGVQSATFRGHHARRVTLTSRAGQSFTAFAVVYRPSWIYVLFAPSGPTFAAVQQSFTPLP